MIPRPPRLPKMPAENKGQPTRNPAGPEEEKNQAATAAAPETPAPKKSKGKKDATTSGPK